MDFLYCGNYTLLSSYRFYLIAQGFDAQMVPASHCAQIIFPILAPICALCSGLILFAMVVDRFLYFRYYHNSGGLKVVPTLVGVVKCCKLFLEIFLGLRNFWENEKNRRKFLEFENFQKFFSFSTPGNYVCHNDDTGSNTSGATWKFGIGALRSGGSVWEKIIQ